MLLLIVGCESASIPTAAPAEPTLGDEPAALAKGSQLDLSVNIKAVEERPGQATALKVEVDRAKLFSRRGMGQEFLRLVQIQNRHSKDIRRRAGVVSMGLTEDQSGNWIFTVTTEDDEAKRNVPDRIEGVPVIKEIGGSPEFLPASPTTHKPQPAIPGPVQQEAQAGMRVSPGRTSRVAQSYCGLGT